MGQGRERNRLRCCRHLLLGIAAGMENTQGQHFKAVCGRHLHKIFCQQGFLRTPLTHCLGNLPQNRDSHFFFSPHKLSSLAIKVRQQNSIQVLTRWIIPLAFAIERQNQTFSFHSTTVVKNNLSHLPPRAISTAGFLQSFSARSR